MNIVSYFGSNSELFLFCVFLFSLMIGSFLNVVIYRLPVMLKQEWKRDCIGFLSEEADCEEFNKYLPNNLKPNNIEKEAVFNLAVPRSRCPSCGHTISALENIPILSWLILRGKCSECASAISIRYPIIELMTACLSVLVAHAFGVQWFTFALVFLTWSLIVLTMIDFDTQLLPDNITLPVLWLGILLSALNVSNVTLHSSVIGAMVGYLSLWSIYQLFKLITGKEGMGFGDFKLLALLGAWLGWQALPLILLLSACVGTLVGVSLILFFGQSRNKPIPFGPYLASAGIISLLWGEEIKQTYFGLVGL